MVEGKRADVVEADGLDFERGFVHLEVEAVFRFAFGLDQTGSYGAAGLEEMDAIFVAFEDLGDGFVFVGPDYEVEKLGDHAFGDRVAARHA